MYVIQRPGDPSQSLQLQVLPIFVPMVSMVFIITVSVRKNVIKDIKGGEARGLFDGDCQVNILSTFVIDSDEEMN